jgi:lipoprotein-anchoring transpeptidase ErfK/SrfK
MCRVQPADVAEALQICRGLRLIFSRRAFSRRKRGDPLGSQLRFVSRIVLTGWVANLSTDMKRVARFGRGCRDNGRFNPSVLAAATAAAVALTLAMPVKPAAAQGWNAVWYEYPARPRLKVRPKAKTQAPVPEQVSKEPFGQIRKGPLQIIISIDQQKLHLYSDGSEVAETLVATGVPGHPTPVGVFSIIQKDRLHHSNIYSGAPMPFMQRITWSGVALHEGGNLGHPASHGCVRLPHDFATRLWVLTRLGARVIIARPELRPSDFADPHLFVHRETSPAVPTASQPTTDKPIKTAQSLPEDKRSDAPAASAEDPKEPARPTSDASARTDKPEGASSLTRVADGSGESGLRPSLSDPPTAPANEPAPAADAASKTDAPADKAEASASKADTPAAKADAPASTADAPQTPPAISPVALPAVPVPPIKPAEIAHSAPRTPISIFISGKEKKIFVRQDFLPLFSAPVTIAHPERQLGTHVFTALSFADDHAHFRWNVVSLPGEQPRGGARALANNSRIEIERRFARGKNRDESAGAPDVLPPPQTPQEALARIEIPQDIIDRISDLIIPGSSLTISDQGLGGETGEGTDFIVVMR